MQSKVGFRNLIKASKPKLPNYLSIAGRKTNRFMIFSKVLERYKTQTASSRIWTQVTDSISYDVNC